MTKEDVVFVVFKDKVIVIPVFRNIKMLIGEVKVL